MMPAWLTAKLISWIAGPAAIGLAIACAVLAIQKGSLHDQIHDPETGYAARLERAQSDLTQCRANRITLEDATRRQNEAVTAARNESVGRIAELQRELQRAEGTAQEARRRADRILAAEGTGDMCLDADELIMDSVGD